MDIRLSRYGRASTRPSPVNRMMADFAHDFRDGIDINLGVGYVNEQTIPESDLVEAMQAVAADHARYRQAFNYGNPAGSRNLIESIRQFLLRTRLGRLDEGTLDRKRLAIGPCGATSILDALSEILEPGIVVTSDPNYYIYSETLERKGFEVLAVPEDGEGIEPAALHHKLEALGDGAARIAFFYVVTVNNPSCTILSNARRRALLEVAADFSRRQNRAVPIFFDLAYELLLHDPGAEPFESALPLDDMDIAYEVGTLSKVLAPAMRIGYILGPRGPLMSALIQKTSDTGFSAPLFVQEMASWLLDHRIEVQLRRVNEGYREKALAVRTGIAQNLGPLLEECRGGSAGFYFYLTFRDLQTHPASPLFRLLTAGGGTPRVIYIPGEYCVHPRGDLATRGLRQLRLSYGFESVSRILEALELMREAASATG